MRRVNLVKTCSIIGFVLAEVYMLFVVLAPNHHPIKGTRMFIPESLIPKVEGIAPGAEPPLGAKIKRVLIAGLFFGPFGAMVGLGIGLLLEGARQSFSRRNDHPKDPPAP